MSKNHKLTYLTQFSLETPLDVNGLRYISFSAFLFKGNGYTFRDENSVESSWHLFEKGSTLKGMNLYLYILQHRTSTHLPMKRVTSIVSYCHYAKVKKNNRTDHRVKRQIASIVKLLILVGNYRYFLLV